MTGNRDREAPLPAQGRADERERVRAELGGFFVEPYNVDDGVRWAVGRLAGNVQLVTGLTIRQAFALVVCLEKQRHLLSQRLSLIQSP